MAQQQTPGTQNQNKNQKTGQGADDVRQFNGKQKQNPSEAGGNRAQGGKVQEKDLEQEQDADMDQADDDSIRQ